MKKIVFALLMACASFSISAANLVTNGDFETGDLTGWALSGNTSFSMVTTGNGGNNTFAWMDGPVGSVGTLTQNLATTAGGLYNLSFDVYNTATTGTSFQASFDGQVVHLFQNEVQNWTHYTIYNLEAGSASTSLAFSIRNDPSYVGLDNVTVMAAVPEPETYGMLLAGLGLLGWTARRRKA